MTETSALVRKKSTRRAVGFRVIVAGQGQACLTPKKGIIMITLAIANQIIDAAMKKAKEIKQPMCIAVVDEGGNMVQHVRMDGGLLGSIDISLHKAYTARAFNMTTKELAGHSQPGSQFYGIHISNIGKIMIFAGGIPLKHKGKIVGAIGVSSGSEEQDVAVAEAGVAEFERIA